MDQATKNKRLAELLERKNQLDAQIQAIRSAEATKKRKEEDGRKMLAGAWALSVLRSGGEQAEWVRAGLDAYLKTDRDRQRLGLPILPGQDQGASQ